MISSKKRITHLPADYFCLPPFQYIMQWKVDEDEGTITFYIEDALPMLDEFDMKVSFKIGKDGFPRTKEWVTLDEDSIEQLVCVAVDANGKEHGLHTDWMLRFMRREVFPMLKKHFSPSSTSFPPQVPDFARRKYI